jgi:hypothetical protein
MLNASTYIDIDRLTAIFQSHVASLESAGFVCSCHAAFESWFRVELVPALKKLGVAEDKIHTDFTYPSSKSKADLVVYLAGGKTIFELKCFVSGQESNKRNAFPIQLNRLLGSIGNNEIIQVIALTTYIGYASDTVTRRMQNLFRDSRWNVVGPCHLVKNYPLQICVADSRVEGRG